MLVSGQHLLELMVSPIFCTSLFFWYFLLGVVSFEERESFFSPREARVQLALLMGCANSFF